MFRDMYLFVDRAEAGEQLAAKLVDEPLVKQESSNDLFVLSIPRGGVVIGATIARSLQCEHDVIVVKKIGFPGHEELAIGAIAEDGAVALNRQVTNWAELKDKYIRQKEAWVRAKIKIYTEKFRQGRPLAVAGKTVIVVDDGIATGETMKAAIIWLRSLKSVDRPKAVLVATPVCSPRAATEFEQIV